LDAARNPRQLHNRLVEPVDVGRIGRCGCVSADGGGKIVEVSQPRAIKHHVRDGDGAAKVSAAVVMDVKTKVDAGADGVGAVDPAQVVDDLRRGDGARR